MNPMLARIPDSYSRPKALAVLSWLAGIPGALVAGVGFALSSNTVFLIGFWLVGLAMMAFFVFSIWGIWEFISGRRTPWRRPN